MHMSSDSIKKARTFVASVELPKPPTLAKTRRVAKGPAFSFDAAKDQATVVGSNVISFVKGITPEQRTDIVHASLLAQLVAKTKVAEPNTLKQVKKWYEQYFDVLSHVGFVIQDKGFAKYEEKSQDFEAHEAILDVATTLLAGAPGALALVKTTLEALKKTSGDNPWITLFNRESQSAKTARFQVSLVDQDSNAQLLVSLMAFGLEAQSKLTQVLFFKFRSNEVTLEQHSGKVTIDSQVLESVRDQISSRLSAFVNDYFQGLPALQASGVGASSAPALPA
jgi:hypothetical protein